MWLYIDSTAMVDFIKNGKTPPWSCHFIMQNIRRAAFRAQIQRDFGETVKSEVVAHLLCFTMSPKNKKARQDPSQDTPKHAKQLNGEMLYTYLALCKRELDTSKDAGSGLSKAS
ncbi:hypothetical protein GIB67_006120 [Kingdonia uniflora]|uniref:Uncharacterized protein n=1 Tax=Kingdonia uniflora TaxID=39325 RepID=A0A7J7LQ03_9MAGN|nr:hypothetical protein GIB67_006120 [Kingdonia uniflora]